MSTLLLSLILDLTPGELPSGDISSTTGLNFERLENLERRTLKLLLVHKA